MEVIGWVLTHFITGALFVVLISLPVVSFMAIRGGYLWLKESRDMTRALDGKKK